MKKIDINQYSNIVNVLILVCSINLCHFVSNEHSSNCKNSQTNLLILGKRSNIFFFIITVLSSYNLFYQEKELTYPFIYVPLGIILNIATKPHYWFQSIYHKKTGEKINQGNLWSTSMSMFLGELMTFGISPKIIGLLKNKIKNKKNFYLSLPGISFSYLMLGFLFRYMLKKYI